MGEARDAAEVRDAAERALMDWQSQRAHLIRAAYEAGVSKNRICGLAGVSRRLVDAVLGPDAGEVVGQRPYRLRRPGRGAVSSL